MEDKKYKHSNAVPHLVYDCTIENLDERREKAIRFETAKGAMDFLGVKSKNTLLRIRVKGGERITRQIDGKEYIVRNV